MTKLEIPKRISSFFMNTVAFLSECANIDSVDQHLSTKSAKNK